MNGGTASMVGNGVCRRGQQNSTVINPIRTPMQHRVRAARGFTLIEVLVALIVLVLGVLGAAGMTLTALRDGKQSSTRSQAVALAYELADLMRANKGQIATTFIAHAPAPVPSCRQLAGCTPTQMATNDLQEWENKLGGVNLPNPTYVICNDVSKLDLMACDGLATSPLVIKLNWDEKLNDGTFVPTDATNPKPRLVMQVQP